MQCERGVIDDVAIGAIARGEHAPIMQAIHLRGVLGHLVHDKLDGHAWPTEAIAREVGKHVGRHARIDKHAAMRTAIRQTKHALWMFNARTLGFKIAGIVAK